MATYQFIVDVHLLYHWTFRWESIRLKPCSNMIPDIQYNPRTSLVYFNTTHDDNSVPRSHLSQGKGLVNLAWILGPNIEEFPNSLY